MEYTIPKVSCRLILKEDDVSYTAEPILSPDDMICMMKKLLQTLDREVVAVINFDNGLRPINWSIVAVGTLNSAQFNLSNIFKTAILSNAAAIMLFHNHPGGTISPSSEDDEATRKTESAGKLLGIRLVDHIIVGAFNDSYYSYGEHGRL